MIFWNLFATQMELDGERCRSSEPPFSMTPTSLLHPQMWAEEPVPAGCAPEPCPEPAASRAASAGTAEQHRGMAAARGPTTDSGMLCRLAQQCLLPVLLASGRKTRCIAAPRKGCSLPSFA